LLDTVEHCQERCILPEPALQQAPLSQQRLVRWLDRLFLATRDIGRQQPLLDEKIDERTRLGGDFGQTGDTATRRTRVGVDAGKPGD
jgi:hypothetical protein